MGDELPVHGWKNSLIQGIMTIWLPGAVTNRVGYFSPIASKMDKFPIISSSGCLFLSSLVVP